MKIKTARNKSGQLITILTDTFDQAALHGLLNQLYSQGLPLHSVTLLKVH